ncbi:nonsense-mediated mRNA decay factor SMG8 [Anopheles ziemanni]|uniref:nonsense-mediated mRNA decay factor SMG8 n=1 Tax=Anopheles coustani TaxID=139045 RepID=UPI002659BF06|nr:nonsense-mediated mRNA decay factor SMG8 [Anopheles coustani]XP_058166210.1 nonsense-mediated mRNA decay factor SMG8 [Anopheles ziemanni]
MKPFESFVFPTIPSELRERFLDDEKQMVVVGVLGKSFEPHCSKLLNFDLLHTHPGLGDETGTDGRVKFFFRPEGNTLFLHFDATFDNFVLMQLAEQMLSKQPDGNPAHFIEFNSAIRTRFARVLLLALQVCHILVLVEPSVSFDMSYLSIFKSLKIIREKYVLKFLPKLLRNADVGAFMGKECRLCSPRLIFMFNLPESSETHTPDDLELLETKVEDYINKIFRNEFIITNNSAMSLFSVSKNKQFVFYNDLKSHRQDPLGESIELLSSYLSKQQKTSTGTLPEQDEQSILDSVRPYDFFGYPLKYHFNMDVDVFDDDDDERSILGLINDHVVDGLETGFDETSVCGRQKSKVHFALPSTFAWFEMFKYMYELFIVNPNAPYYDAYDPDYKAFLENFHDIVDIDEQFFGEICEHGLELAMMNYKEMLPPHYSFSFHETKYQAAQNLLMDYARGPELKPSIEKLKEYCDSIWQSGKQQCEYPSLRGNPCVLGKHKPIDASEHSSGVIYVSACNCGRTQGHREDPYTIRQANYEFYQIIAKSCSNCNRLERVQFPIFEPSVSDFRAAEFINKNFSNLMSFDSTGRTASDVAPNFRTAHENSLFLSGSQKSQNTSESLSFNIGSEVEEDELDGNVAKKIGDRRNRQTVAEQNDQEQFNTNRDDFGEDDEEVDEYNGDDEQILNINARMKEIVIKVGGSSKATGSQSNDATLPTALSRQPSTTEYLPGMLHAASPAGLLPRFPSWSLVCLGSSSIYTHNTGLPEHVQSGFLSGSNFLLPWDVSVRLEHAQCWAASYEKIRNRKKGNQHSSKGFEQNNTFTLKIFIGVEYECLRGHRFIMNGPDSILRSATEIARDSGSKVVFNDMPIYYPCPCRNTINNTAQLMRVHIITPKAPVNVIIDPKVKIFQNNMQNCITFTSGMAAPIKLPQSSYWILRLPFVYEGDSGPLAAPTNVNPSSAIMHGALMAGMYGIRENELNEETAGGLLNPSG